MRVLCTRAFYDNASNKFYQEGRVYDVHPLPELANFFGFDVELRAKLRAEHAAILKRPASPQALAKAAVDDANRLIEIAHNKGLNAPAEPKTLVDLAPKSAPIVDKPVILSEITKALDNSAFLE